jgi:hypothetical protein
MDPCAKVVLQIWRRGSVARGRLTEFGGRGELGRAGIIRQYQR